MTVVTMCLLLHVPLPTQRKLIYLDIYIFFKVKAENLTRKLSQKAYEQKTVAKYLGYAGYGAALERRENLARSIGRRDRKGRKDPQKAVSSMDTGSGPHILPLLLT